MRGYLAQHLEVFEARRERRVEVADAEKEIVELCVNQSDRTCELKVTTEPSEHHASAWH